MPPILHLIFPVGFWPYGETQDTSIATLAARKTDAKQLLELGETITDAAAIAVITPERKRLVLASVGEMASTLNNDFFRQTHLRTGAFERSTCQNGGRVWVGALRQ